MIDSQGGVRGVHGTPPLPHRQRDQGDAAGQLSAKGGLARAERSRATRAQSPAADDPGLVQRCGDLGLHPAWAISAPPPPRAARGHGPVLICCSWGYARFSARDQAKFFWQLERLTPPRFRDYATKLLRSIISSQSWGIPKRRRVPRGFSVFFKGGWGTTALGSARPPGVVRPLPRHGLLARRADRRQPVDELRDRHDLEAWRAGSGASRARRSGTCVRLRSDMGYRDTLFRCWYGAALAG